MFLAKLAPSYGQHVGGGDKMDKSCIDDSICAQLAKKYGVQKTPVRVHTPQRNLQEESNILSGYFLTDCEMSQVGCH